MDFAARTRHSPPQVRHPLEQPVILRRHVLALILAAFAPAAALAQAPAAKPPAPRNASGVGVVTEINAAEAVVTLKHEPIPALGWPSMTMPFHLASPALLTGLKVGQKVAFETREADGLPEITAIRRR
jgi:Cu/Ag efflux protein CusF